MTRTVTHLYDTYDAASLAVSRLEQAGIAHDDISIVGHGHDRTSAVATDTHADSGAGTGASVGTLLGGGAGLLAGIGMLAIPGVGPVVAAGWLVATLTGAGAGAAAGGLLGSLTGAGVHKDNAEAYAEGVRRGGSVVAVRTDEADVARIESLMADGTHVDIVDRTDRYRAEGWDRFDPAATGYTSTEVESERARRARLS
jgi:hypothetical protein